MALQDELDANEKLFVGGQHLRYTGTLKFYSPRRFFLGKMCFLGWKVVVLIGKIPDLTCFN